MCGKDTRFLFLARVIHPYLEPSILGSPSVQTPTNFPHESLSRKKLNSMFITSSAFVVVFSGLLLHLMLRGEPNINQQLWKLGLVCGIFNLEGKEGRESEFRSYLKFDYYYYLFTQNMNNY